METHPGYVGQGVGDEEHQAGEQLHLPEAQRRKPHEPDAQVGQAEQPEQLECLQGKIFRQRGLSVSRRRLSVPSTSSCSSQSARRCCHFFGLGQKAQQPAGEVLYQRRDAQQHQRHDNHRYHSVCHGQIPHDTGGVGGSQRCCNSSMVAYKSTVLLWKTYSSASAPRRGPAAARPCAGSTAAPGTAPAPSVTTLPKVPHQPTSSPPCRRVNCGRRLRTMTHATHPSRG